jgi:hypothetical protein
MTDSGEYESCAGLIYSAMVPVAEEVTHNAILSQMWSADTT